MQLLEDFIYSEQIRNNFSLYSSKKVESLFKMDLKQEYLPENRSYFKIPYYLVPIKSTFLRYTHEYEDFLSENFFIKNNEKLYYPFFVHPSSENIFKLWIKDKFRYIDSDNSIFLATPTSSYRTLSIINVRTEKQFFAKTSIFGNVAKQLLPNKNKNQETRLLSNDEQYNQLKHIKELLDSGAITQEEYDAKKKQLLEL